MTGVMRFLFALFLGIIIGAGSVVYGLHAGYGDFVIQRTHAVQDLERRLVAVEEQRNQLGRELEGVAARAARMEAAFETLEGRFQAMQKSRMPAPPAGAGAPTPSTAPSP